MSNAMFHSTKNAFLSGFLLTACLIASSVQAAKVAGVELEESLSIGSHEMTFNGAGLRKRLFIKLYVGSLYLANASSDASAIIEADEAMSIRINVLSDLLTRNKMIKALKDGFRKATGGNTAAIRPQIDQMLDSMQEKIRPGDSYTLSYEPGVGTHIMRGDETLSTIEGLAFKQALFGIWLSDSPAQASLKKAMLGG